MPARTRLTRAESKAKTRDALLRAANRLFHRNGFAATTVDEIAEEAGVTSGAVYSNFATKEDLFLALIDEAQDPRASWISEHDTAPADLSSATGRTPEERAANLGRAMSAKRPDRRSVAMIMEMNAAALRSARSRKRVVEHNLAFFRDVGAQLVDALDADDADAELLGLMMQSIFAGLTAHTALTGEPLGEDVYARAYRLLAVLAHDGTHRA